VPKKKAKQSDLQIAGVNIRRIRELHKISCAQLAFEIETTEKQLSRIENGEINSGIMSYIKIARALNINLLDLFSKLKF
jgi:transcriptional regulator with XRE-family HTH domain